MPARRTTYAIAASVAVAAVSVPVLLHYLAQYPQGSLTLADGEAAAKQQMEADVRGAERVRQVTLQKQEEQAQARGADQARLAASEPAKPNEEKARAQNQPAQTPARDSIDALGQASQVRRELKDGLLGGAGHAARSVDQRASVQPAAPMGYAGPTLLSRLDQDRQSGMLLPPPQQVEQGRDRFDATPPNPVKSVAQRAGLHLLHRCGHGLLLVRAARAECRAAAAEGRRARRGDDQLFPLRLCAARRARASRSCRP